MRVKRSVEVQGRTRRAQMTKRRLGALAAAVVALLVAFPAAGAGNAAATKPSCDVQGFWNGPFAGQLAGDQGDVTFQISTQDADENKPGADNDKNVKFTWTATAVPNGASASGTGKLHVTSPTSADFTISGTGTEPVYGAFSVNASGTVACSGGQGSTAMGTFHVAFSNGMTDNGTVGPLFHEDGEV
jgi:hypothetical protein